MVFFVGLTSFKERKKKKTTTGGSKFNVNDLRGFAMPFEKFWPQRDLNPELCDADL